jgi:hypothetical protein
MKKTLLLLITFFCSILTAYSQSSNVSLPDGISMTFPSEPTVTTDTALKRIAYQCSVNNTVIMVTVTHIPNIEWGGREAMLSDKGRQAFYDGFITNYNGKLVTDKESTYKNYKCYDYMFNLTIENSLIKYAQGRLLACDKQFIAVMYYYDVFDDEVYKALINSISFIK